MESKVGSTTNVLQTPWRVENPSRMVYRLFILLAFALLASEAQGQQPGSCAGICGNQSAGGCWCDSGCAARGDCCNDFCFECNSSHGEFTCGACCTGTSCLWIAGQDNCFAQYDGFHFILGNQCFPGNPCPPPPPTCGDAGTGTCCEDNGTAFCDNATCCAAVCAIAPSCCNVAWDATCVALAQVNRDCDCEEPPPPLSCGDERAGACCDASGNGTSHCNDTGCCKAVCDDDPSCCASDGEWDETCADIAQDICVVCQPPPPPSLALLLNPTTCYKAGDTLTVLVVMQDMTEIITGGQYFLLYDDDSLTFTSASPADAPSPFTLEVNKIHKSGLLIYATGVNPMDGGAGTDGTAVMAKLTFTAQGNACDVASLISFTAGTLLTDDTGQEVLDVTYIDLPAITIDVTPPVILAGSDANIACDNADECAGRCGGPSASGCSCEDGCADFSDCCDAVCLHCPDQDQCAATATDNCDRNPLLTFSDEVIEGTCAQAYTVARTWTAVDCSENEAQHVQYFNIGSAPPVVSGVPDDITQYSDAGVCGALVTWTEPTAVDACLPGAPVNVQRSHNPGDFFGVGFHVVTYTFTDECENEVQVDFTVEVLPVSVLSVDIALAGLTGNVDRCIAFSLSGDTNATFSETLSFASGAASALFEIACGEYTCVVAKDELHTLSAAQPMAIAGAEFVASFTGADALVGGDLNNDDVIDILDFGVFVWQFGANYGPGSGDTPCGTPYPHADLTGDGLVDGAEFTFIQIGFLQAGAAACALPQAGGRGLTRISVRELRRRGLGELAIADLNGDGFVDETDIVLWLSGVRP